MYLLIVPFQIYLRCVMLNKLDAMMKMATNDSIAKLSMDNFFLQQKMVFTQIASRFMMHDGAVETSRQVQPRPHGMVQKPFCTEKKISAS